MHCIAPVLFVVCFASPASGVDCEVAPAPGFEICQNDCNLDGVVTVDEIIAGVRIGAGAAMDTCPEADRNSDGVIGAGDIDASVSAALAGCPAAQTHPKLACPPGETMCNVAAAAGLDDAAYGKGTAIVDVDADGWDDIWASDSDNRSVASGWGTSSLYRNNRDGTFTKQDIGIDDGDLFLNWEGSFADYDNDGDPDLLLTNGGYGGASSLALYRNDVRENGKFTNVSEAAGLHAGSHAWWGASWADFDLDGWLDFAVTPLAGRLVLYHNLGNGTFEELPVTPDADTRPTRDEMKNPLWFDYNLDGDPDLYVAGVYPLLYRNDGGGLFTEIGDPVEPTEYYKIPFVFAASADDFNQDGWPDLYLGRFMMQDLLLLNRGNGTFEWHAKEIGIDKLYDSSGDSPLKYDDPKWTENTMGLAVGDLNLDGMPEVFIGTGNPAHKYPDILFCNTGTPPDVSFARCSDAIVRGHGAKQTHGIALGDLDADGDVDVFYNLGGMTTFDGVAYANARDSHAFYVSEPAERPNTAVVRFEGRRSNRDAIGTRVRVEGSSTRYYTVQSTQGFQSQNSAWQVLTLGTAKSGTATITWPLGGECTVHLKRGDRIAVREPAPAEPLRAPRPLAAQLHRKRSRQAPPYEGPPLSAPFPRCSMEGHSLGAGGAPR